MHQLDVNSTFLNRLLEDEVYVSQLPDFVLQGHEKKVDRLRKRIDNFLSQIGFVKCISEHGLYMISLKVTSGIDLLIVCLYVDD